MSWRSLSSSCALSRSTSSSLALAVLEEDPSLMFVEPFGPALPSGFDLGGARVWVGSSSSREGTEEVIPPRAEALRGPMLAFLSSLGRIFGVFLLVPWTLRPNFDAVGLPNLAGGFEGGWVADWRGAGVSWSLRTGESGRGRDVRGRLPWGLAARPAPTDGLNFGMDGVGGV